MTAGEVTVRRARGADEVERAIALRAAVFVDEQGVSREDEIDGRDDAALHLVAVAGDDEIVGTCRLLTEGEKVKLARMVVAREHRGSGIAGLLLDAAAREARALGGRQIVLAAQLTAVGVYERAGYLAHGDVFLDAGIEHRRMEKRLV